MYHVAEESNPDEGGFCEMSEVHTTWEVYLEHLSKDHSNRSADIYSILH